MACTDATLAPSTEHERAVDIDGRFWKLEVDLFPKVRARLEVVAHLAAWFDQRDDGPDTLPGALVVACEDLRQELEGINSYVNNLGREVREAAERMAAEGTL